MRPWWWWVDVRAIMVARDGTTVVELDVCRLVVDVGGAMWSCRDGGGASVVAGLELRSDDGVSVELRWRFGG